MEIRFSVFYIFMLIYWSGHSGRTSSNNESEKPRRRFYKKWSTEEEEKLLFFDVLTDDGQPNSFARVKSYWHDAYPNSNVTDVALHKKLYKLREESHEKGETRRRFKWSSEVKAELLNIYYTTRPYNPDARRTLDEEWKQRYKDCQLSRRVLLEYVRRTLKPRRENREFLVEGTSNTGVEWNSQRDSDLLHAHYVAHLEGGAPWKDAHRIWSDLHPQYSHVTLEQLRQRKTYLKNNPPNEYFPWTEEENEELLDIFYKTMPDVEDQGQRIYDIWSKRHPRYKFMTPYYLQIHASTLAHEREKQEAHNLKRHTYTHEERADLMNLYRRYVGERPRRYGFHKEWVHKYPRLAYLTSEHLKDYVRQIENRRFIAASKTLEGSFHEEKEKYTSEKEQELHGRCVESSSKGRRHSEGSVSGSRKKHEAHTPRKFRSMKKLIDRLEKQTSEKPHGKAPVVYSSDEQDSPPASMSEGHD